MTKYELDRQLQMPQGDTFPYVLSHHPDRREDADWRSNGNLHLRLRVEANVVFEGEVVCLMGEEPVRVEMTRQYVDPHEEVWESDAIAWSEPFEYYFRLQTVTGQALFGATGMQASLPKEARFRITECNAVQIPAWARGAVFYQIFPDRFCRLGTQMDELESWDSPPTPMGFKGGTLRGITSKLDYLKDLGVDGLWLNPVFSSPSNHRYDTTDFFMIDPRLGTMGDLQELADQAHVRGIRVILDGVFNHVSEHHPFFEDVVRSGPLSRYWSWFKMRSWPVEKRSEEFYSAWWGHAHLPELDLANPEVQEYFIDVGTQWTREANIDGWRLDVAGEVPIAFWRKFRDAIRGTKTDTYLLAEVWGDARPFVQGDAFDATMNYPFRRTVIEFLTGRINADVCARHLNRLYHRLPKEVAEVQYNLLGSHDVSRVRDDLQDDLGLVELALAIQYAYPGIVALYYGDELGLEGSGDPGCRKAYPWDQTTDGDLRELIRSAAVMRSEAPALRVGTMECHADGEHTLQISRRHPRGNVDLTVDRLARKHTWTRQ